MSKKIAEGIGGLVLDVKCGDGAFMKTEEDARALARSLVDTGELAGVRTEALLTRMDAPLGLAVGNALEIVESIETLKGNGPADLESLSVEFAARMLVLSGIEPDVDRATARVRKALSSGAGLEKLREIIANQGGDPRVIDDYSRLPAAPDTDVLAAPRDGVVAAMRAESRRARGGRARRGPRSARRGDRSAVGFMIVAPVGTRVKAGDPIVEIHHRNGHGLADARRLLEAAIQIGDAPVSGTSAGARSHSKPRIARKARILESHMSSEHGVAGEIAYQAPKRAPYEGRDFAVIGIAAAAAGVCALTANLLHLPRLQPLTGLIVIMAIAYSFSTNRRAIDRRTVAWGLGLQILFALIVLKTEIGQRVFKALASVINHLLDFAFVGSSFVFGPLGSKVVWPKIMTTVLGPRGRSTASSSRSRCCRRSSSSRRSSPSSITSASCSSSSAPSRSGCTA